MTYPTKMVIPYTSEKWPQRCKIKVLPDWQSTWMSPATILIRLEAGKVSNSLHPATMFHNRHSKPVDADAQILTTTHQLWCFHNVKPLSLRVGHPAFGVNSPFLSRKSSVLRGILTHPVSSADTADTKVPVAWYRYEPPMPLADHSRWRWAICPGGNGMLNWSMKIAFNWKFEWENHRAK